MHRPHPHPGLGTGTVPPAGISEDELLRSYPELRADAEFARVRVRIPEGYTPRPKKPHEVWILSEVSRFPALEFVAVHEVRHVWQKAKDITVFGDECRAEGDAYPYSYGALRRYLMAKGRLTQELELEIATRRESACRAFAQAWPNGKFATLEI